MFPVIKTVTIETMSVKSSRIIGIHMNNSRQCCLCLDKVSTLVLSNFVNWTLLVKLQREIDRQAVLHIKGVKAKRVLSAFEYRSK